MLTCMDEAGDLLAEAVGKARNVLADLIVHAGLQLQPGVLLRRMAR